MKLCKFCNQRFHNRFEEGECYICRGKMERIVELIENYKPNLPFKSFGISSIIPKEYFKREEDAFDVMLGESIKNQVNRFLIQRFQNKQYRVNDYDIKFILDFENERIVEEFGDLFVFGKYFKLKPFLSQKRWRKKKFLSIEEVIGEELKRTFKADDYFMHASGREDVDAINTGGRPFVFELRKARVKDMSLLKEVEKSINQRNDVNVVFFGRVPGSFVTVVSDTHSDKAYRAYLNRTISKDERSVIEKFFKNRLILQKTPTRVLRRRADKVRKRKVYEVKAFSNFLEIKCEAGLYVKELISGDSGRTTPSVSEVLGKDLKCTKLEVTFVDDRFIMHIFKHVKYD